MEKKSKFSILPVLILAGLAIAALNYFTTCQKSKPDVADGLKDYFEIKSEVDDVLSEYTDYNGYVDEKKTNDSLNAVLDYAVKLKNEKKIEDYNITHGCSVWMKLNSGIQYLYIPAVKETDSAPVSTYQPCLHTYDTYYRDVTTEMVDGVADNIASNTGSEFKNNLDNADVTLDAIKNLGDNRFVIWHGHGGYNSETHSILLTSVELDYDEFMKDTEYYVSHIGFEDDLREGRIVCTQSGYVCVTPKFFEEYLDDDNETEAIYLGACETGKDDVLPEVFVRKGIEVVVANTKSIPTYYNVSMIRSFYNKFTSPSGSPSAAQALKAAKNDCADISLRYGNYSDVKIWGNDSYVLPQNSMNTYPSDLGVIHENDRITVYGMLEQVVNEESTMRETVTLLRLKAPLKCDPVDYQNYKEDVEYVLDSVQIADSGADDYIGEEVQVTGKVFYQHTIHHMELVLLSDCTFKVL